MATIPSIKPPISAGDLANFAKPQTQWTQLPNASNAEQFNTYRKTAKVFFLIAAVSAVGTTVVLPFSSRKAALFMYSGLGIVITAVVGGVLRSFSNIEGILKLREEVQKNIEHIEKSSLANIRQTYPDLNVISNEELNEWARYFLHTQPFDQFFSAQWSSLFTFKLDESTEELIRQKYFYCIYHPSDPKNISLFNHVLESRLFTPVERDNIKKFHASLQSQVPEASVRQAVTKFQEWNAKVTQLSPELYPAYAWLRGIYVWHRKGGIKVLETNASKEFGQDLASTQVLDHFKSYRIERYLADRDATSKYDQFVDANGLGTIELISILPCFLQFILQQNLGLKETFERYQAALDRFGVKKQVRAAVLDQEWKQLSRFTYTEIRERNGEDAVTGLTDPEVKRNLKDKFLGLPSCELAVAQEKYKHEIAELGITDKEIETKLSQTWGGMNYEAILSLPPASRSRILNFSKKAGKGKALGEIKHLPVMKVLDIYLQLFTDKILDLADYEFTTKIDGLPIEHFAPLIQKHWKFIFDKELLTKQAFNLQLFVSSFMHQQQEIFLFEKTLPTDGVWEMLETLDLISKALKSLRTSTNTAREHEALQHKQKLAGLKGEYTTKIEGIPQVIEERNRKAFKAHASCQTRLRQAEEAHAAALTAFSGFLEETLRWEAEVRVQTQTYEKDNEICTELKRINERLIKLAEDLQNKQYGLRDLEEELKNQNERSATVAKLRRGIEEIRENITQGLAKKDALAAKRDGVLEKLSQLSPEAPPLRSFSHHANDRDAKSKDSMKGAENRAGTGSPVLLASMTSPPSHAKGATLLNSVDDSEAGASIRSPEPLATGRHSSGHSTQDDLAAADASSSADSSSKKPTNQEQLQAELRSFDDEVDVILENNKAYRRQIEEKGKMIKDALVDYSGSAKHQGLAKEITSIREENEALEANKKGMLQNYDYEILITKVKHSKVEIDRVPLIKIQRKVREEELQKNVEAALRAKNAAFLEEQEAAAKLNDTTLAEQLKKEAGQKKEREENEEEQRFKGEDERIKKTVREEFGRLLRS